MIRILYIFCFTLFIVDCLLLLVTFGTYDIDGGLCFKLEKFIEENE